MNESVLLEMRMFPSAFLSFDYLVLDVFFAYMKDAECLFSVLYELCLCIIMYVCSAPGFLSIIKTKMIIF